MLKCRKRINQLRNNTILVMLQFFFRVSTDKRRIRSRVFWQWTRSNLEKSSHAVSHSITWSSSTAEIKTSNVIEQLKYFVLLWYSLQSDILRLQLLEVTYNSCPNWSLSNEMTIAGQFFFSLHFSRFESLGEHQHKEATKQRGLKRKHMYS